MGLPGAARMPARTLAFQEFPRKGLSCRVWFGLGFFLSCRQQRENGASWILVVGS